MGDEIKAIILDHNGVFVIGNYPEHPTKGYNTISFHEFVSKKLNISIDTWFDAIDSPYALSITGKYLEKEVLKEIAQHLCINSQKVKRAVYSSYRKSFKQNKVLFKTVFKLKKKGYMIAIISDQWPVSKNVLMKKKYMKHFNEVIISCDVGLRKPDEKIYALTLKKLKIRAKNCVFIDDRKGNLVPAKKLGMKVILFENNDKLNLDFKKIGVEL